MTIFQSSCKLQELINQLQNDCESIFVNIHEYCFVFEDIAHGRSSEFEQYLQKLNINWRNIKNGIYSLSFKGCSYWFISYQGNTQHGTLMTGSLVTYLNSNLIDLRFIQNSITNKLNLLNCSISYYKKISKQEYLNNE